jgi:hypothetical protein
LDQAPLFVSSFSQQGFLIIDLREREREIGEEHNGGGDEENGGIY